ncbi:MAG: hypothetical protein ABIJ83_04000 [Patescibacteria group bacterium]
MDSKTEIAAKIRKTFILMCLDNRCTETKIINPKIEAFKNLTTSRRGMPDKPKTANNVGNKGGHLTKGVPSYCRYPLPNNKFAPVAK